jgi:hypothetical protein
MIFCSALTKTNIYNGKPALFATQYLYLLRSIARVYPEATCVLYKLTDFPEGDIAAFAREVKDFRVVDRRGEFDIEVGLDTNFARTIQHCREENPGEVVVGLDCDCVVAKRFDDLLEDGIDVVMSTRGYLMNEHGRQDIVWAPALYRPNDRATEFLDRLLERVTTERWMSGDGPSWFEVQTEVSEMLAEANPALNDYLWDEARARIVPDFEPVVCDLGFAVVKVVNFIELANSIPSRYRDASVIHYKREKKHYLRVFKGVFGVA